MDLDDDDGTAAAAVPLLLVVVVVLLSFCNDMFVRLPALKDVTVCNPNLV